MSTPTNQKPVVERFRDIAEQVLTDAQAAATVRDCLDREITAEAGRENTDATEAGRLENELEELERQLEQLKSQAEALRQRRAGRAQWMTERLAERASAAADATRLEDEGRRAMAVVEQMSTGPAAEPETGEQAGEGSALPAGVVPVGPEFGSPLATVKDPLPTVEQDGSQPS